MAFAVIHGFSVDRKAGLTPTQTENLFRWVEALRSGAYSQGRDCLREGDRFCCLGVACDVLGASWSLRERRWYADEVWDMDLPKDRTAAFGCESCGPLVYDSTGFARSAMELNDEEKLSFAQIADIIAYWAGLEEPAAAGNSVEEERS